MSLGTCHRALISARHVPGALSTSSHLIWKEYLEAGIVILLFHTKKLCLEQAVHSDKTTRLIGCQAACGALMCDSGT